MRRLSSRDAVCEKPARKLEAAAAATCASGRQTALPRAEHPVPVSMMERDDVDAPSVLAGPRPPIQDCAFPRVIATATRLARLREGMPLSKAIAGIGVRCEPQSGGGA